MTGRSNFEVLLDLLAEESAVGDPSYRGGGEGSGLTGRRREVARQVRESTEAQLTLFLLAWRLTADAVDSDAQRRAEVVAFAETVAERFGVDLLAVAAANRDRLPPDVPEDFLARTRTADTT